MTLHWISAQHLRSAAVLMIGLVTVGCSSYAGQKLGIKDSKQLAPAGLPYSLTRPEFVLSRTAPADGEKNPTYTLAVSYEPDPSQQYDIRISPSLFADGSLAVKFTTAGGVSSTNGGITDLIGPTITALGSFAKDVIASGVFDKNSIRTLVILTMTDKQKPISECNVESVVPAPPEPYTEKQRAKAPFRSVGQEMAQRMRRFAGDDEFLEKFHYMTEAEKQCLIKVDEAIVKAPALERKAAQDQWTIAQTGYKTAQPTDAAFLESVTAAYDGSDLSEIIADGVDNKAAFNKAPLADQPLFEARSALLAAAETAMKLAATSDLSKKLKTIYDMNPSVWLARHVLFLEREVARLRLAVIQRPDISDVSSSEISDYIDQLQRSRARALDVPELYQRAASLVKFLRQIERKTEHGGSAPATSEFATARVELDNVLSQIDARRTKVVAAATPPSAPTIAAIKAQPISSVEEAVITASKADKWADTKAGKEAAQFVVYLREVK